MQPIKYFVTEFIIKKLESSQDTIQDDDIFEFLDGKGNPFKSEIPIHYKFLGKDGTILKEGEFTDNNVIPLKDIGTIKFSVIVDTYKVTNPKDFDFINLDKDSETEGEETSSEFMDNNEEEKGTDNMWLIQTKWLSDFKKDDGSTQYKSQYIL